MVVGISSPTRKNEKQAAYTKMMADDTRWNMIFICRKVDRGKGSVGGRSGDGKTTVMSSRRRPPSEGYNRRR